ncbi:hypothetical protein EJ05DRAFT_151131 [Pseudovirgaria hyperparasitica]|uniref:C2H2-type domain-containing protein n=1 Tax=Pseudovirgaria hyperparasitica TaxID=470096 RepID=A0A6A6VY17_9PEZI|nr:uncharacterized protein EJ05DRAFT_151131 [Pseudovirgaria hyperparasitica]KAF2754177.1 hypothetical protein EJ05DRAFT_151131 [Pseudovirgaria hyperparasitica]
MASTHIHPRRRGVRSGSPQMTPLNTSSPFYKSGTFHSPSNGFSELCNPIVNAAFMPKRSSTSVESLEELLEDAGVRRVTNLIEQFDRTLASGSSPSSSEGSILSDREVLPVPSFVLDHTSMDEDNMDLDVKPVQTDHHHASDSGIGSSLDGSNNEERTGLRSSTRRSVASTTSTNYSAVTRSFSALGSKSAAERSLSSSAIRNIKDKIIKPILAENSLKDFHPLIADVPHRIGSKDISNLRDLEKTLIFLAPVSTITVLSECAIAHCIFRNLKEYSASPESYLSFCERAIQCLHTTVEYLCEREQRLPTDRPYTNNYFLDLVEQIRRYASIMAATRRKQESGEDLDEMDYSPEEKITLRGGLSHNGRPVELVREKDGRVLPIAEENTVDEAFVDHFNTAKRSLEQDSDMDDDEVRRSMARRRKSEKPGDVIHSCPSCSKEFKRPCDLTKHMKTHSRPFKCPEPKCKYHDQGWPTEKERDRHVNDKHSAAPPQYKCLYADCAYVSKRESNCKQHMEKTHGYVYVRSKSNGRSKKPTGTAQAPSTPLTPLIPTPGSGVASSSNTPSTAFEPSPALQTLEYGYGSYTPAMSVKDYDYGAYRRDSNTTAGTYMSGSSSNYSPMQPQLSSNSISPQEPTMNNDLFPGTAFGSYHQQQPTPALSTGFDFNMTFNPAASSNQIPHLSPGAHNLTLLDEGFEDDLNFGNFGCPNTDFQLFDNTAPTGDMDTNWFTDDFSNMGAQLEDFSPDMTFEDHLNI